MPPTGTGWRLLAIPLLFIPWEELFGSNYISRVTPSQSRRGFEWKSRDRSGSRCSVRLTPIEQSHKRCNTAKRTALSFSNVTFVEWRKSHDPLDRLMSRVETSHKNSRACDAVSCELRPDSLAFNLTLQLCSRYSDSLRGWTVRGSNPRKGEIFRTRLDRP